MCFDSSYIRLSIYHPRKNPGDFQEYSPNLTSVRMINCEVGMERVKTVNAKTSRPQMGEGCSKIYNLRCSFIDDDMDRSYLLQYLPSPDDLDFPR